MEIAKNTTKLNKKSLSYFQNQLLLKNSWPVILCALLILIFAFGINDSGIYLRSIFLLIVSIIVYPAFLIGVKFSYLSQNKKAIDTNIEYTFTDEKIIINGSVGQTKENIEMPYSNIQKVIDTKKYIFLFVNPQNAFLVDKNSFEKGDSTKVLALLKLKVA